jgi:uncharacterized protein (DUF1015 family)
MADVRPLRGVRFNRQVSGPIGPLIAPPYDVATRPRDGAEFSIGGVEYVDLGVPGNQHAFAAERYDDWRRHGVLVQDSEPNLYLHRHQFEHNGASRVRTGLLARVRLADWPERVVLPHEQTTPGPRLERLARLRAVQANLSPLYFLYRDPDGAVRELLAHCAAPGGHRTERDRMGGTHQLVPRADPKFHRALGTILAERTLFVADGHHRYEAALSYRNEQREALGRDDEAPWEFVLALLAAVEDPGVAVRPTHRLLTTADDWSPASLLELLRTSFTVSAADGAMPATADGDLLCRVVLPHDYGVWDIRALPGSPHQSLLTPQRGAAWKSLGVVAIEAALMSDPRNAAGLRTVYFVDEGEAMTRVDRGEANAALLFPAPSLDRILTVAEEGDLLPPKSTWFEPKAPAGLVINDLRP